jgi:hypothetical protein
MFEDGLGVDIVIVYYIGWFDHLYVLEASDPT